MPFPFLLRYLPSCSFSSAKGLSAKLGVRAVDVVKILINLGIPPNSSDEFLLPDVVDLVVVRPLLPSFFRSFFLLTFSFCFRRSIVAFQIEKSKIETSTLLPLLRSLTSSLPVLPLSPSLVMSITGRPLFWVCFFFVFNIPSLLNYPLLHPSLVSLCLLYPSLTVLASPKSHR